MTGAVPSSQLLERCLRGDTGAVARLISRAESDAEEVRPILAEIYRRAGHAHVVGITGAPGSGKSTIVARLVPLLRANAVKVGILAVDPSSPYTGGALLADRARMASLADDPGVFIRSMATRGVTGGMAKGALDAADILDVAGYGIVIIETVGVGQDEVEIARASHTTVVVSPPGLGDELQALKAGLLDVAVIHVVSKCDRADSRRTLVDLERMLARAAPQAARSGWMVPVIGTSALTGDGVEQLVEAILGHRAATTETAEGEARALRLAAFRLEKTAELLLLERFCRAKLGMTAELAKRLAAREGDPYALAAELVQRLLP